MAAKNPLTSQLSRSEIISAGATHLNRLTNNSETLSALRDIYSDAIRNTMIVALVAICSSHACLLGMEWLKLGDEQSPLKPEEDAQDSFGSHKENV